MGEAKRRGSKEQRIAQSLERQRLEDARRSAEHKELMKRQQEARFAQARKEGIPPVLVATGAQRRHGMLLALAAAAPFLAMPDAARNLRGKKHG